MFIYISLHFTRKLLKLISLYPQLYYYHYDTIRKKYQTGLYIYAALA